MPGGGSFDKFLVSTRILRVDPLAITPKSNVSRPFARVRDAACEPKRFLCLAIERGCVSLQGVAQFSASFHLLPKNRVETARQADTSNVWCAFDR